VSTTQRLLTTDPSRPPDMWTGASYRPKADCPVCHGAGFVHPSNEYGAPIYDKVVPCLAPGCYHESHQRFLRGEAYGAERGIRPAVQTFSNFLIVPGARAAYETAKAFAEPTATFIWLLLYGKPGNGKSHLCNAVARRLQERGESFKYVKAADIHAEIRRAVQSNQGKDIVLDEYKSVRVLVIDDYGVEKGTDAQDANMEEILVTRYERFLQTMMATNLTWSELPERIASRFQDREMARIVRNDAGDYRGKK
jgi:DNA replication protein DnaC